MLSQHLHHDSLCHRPIIAPSLPGVLSATAFLSFTAPSNGPLSPGVLSFTTSGYRDPLCYYRPLGATLSATAITMSATLTGLLLIVIGLPWLQLVVKPEPDILYRYSFGEEHLLVMGHYVG